MKRIIALAALSAFALAACKDDTQAQLQAQQKQIEALQQQLTQQNQAGQAAQDDTVYQLNADAVASTIPAEFQNGNNGEPVTGTDGQQYVYDQSSGSWLLQSLIGAAAGAMLGNMLANKFSKAPANSPAAQQVRTQYAQQYRGRSPQAPNSLSPRQQAAQGQQQNRQSNANNNTYRQTNQAQPNHQQPRRSMGRGFGRRR